MNLYLKFEKVLVDRNYSGLKALLLIFITIISLSGNAIETANLTQTLRGTIIDKDSRSSLIGANIIILGSNPVLGASTNVDGNFRIENVPVGRINLKLSCIGYEEKTIPNITVESGKEVVLSLDMTESLVEISEVFVTGGRKKGEVLNEMSLLSSRAFSVEETKRYAGSLDDPSRMVSAFAGVTTDPQGTNEIVVRGNTSKGIQWRLEDVEIPSPNHFSYESATGSPINALSSNMLATSDFYMGAFAPEYGNVLSGIFDMKMRIGNNEKHEYTLGFGVLGIDVSGEGPLGKKGSYLFNYRYSSLALLDNLKLVDFGGVPKYQDLSYKINLPTKMMGTFSIFGLGGLSSIGVENLDENSNVAGKGISKSIFGVTGINYILQLNADSYLKTTLAIANNGMNQNWDERKEDDMFENVSKVDLSKITLTAATRYSNKLSPKHRLVVGIDYKHFLNNMTYSYFDKELNGWNDYIDLKNNAGMVQAFASWKYRISEDITLVSGLHYTNFLLNNSQSIEPRAALKWQVTPKTSFNVGFGIHSMPESIITYYAASYDKAGNRTTPNKNLDLTKARHYILGYEHQISKNLNAKAEIYYQDLYNVPVENIDTSNYSSLNEQNGLIQKALVNNGKGRNYGAEITLERFFDNHFYFLATGSLYKSEFKTLENVWHNTKFNGNFAANFLIGREFVFGDRKKDKYRVLNLNTRLTYNGGRRYLPLDLEASRIEGAGVYKTANAYKDKLDNIFQMNLTASLTFNRKHTSHEILIDVYNLLNNQGKVNEYYNEYTKEKEYGLQLGMMPNIMYRIHF